MNALLLTLLMATPDGGVPPAVLPEYRRLAVSLEPMLESAWVKDWLRGVNELKPVKRPAPNSALAPVVWYPTTALPFSDREGRPPGGERHRMRGENSSVMRRSRSASTTINR